MDLSIDIGNTRSKWLLEAVDLAPIEGTCGEPIKYLPTAIGNALAEHKTPLHEDARIRIACVRNQQAKQLLAQEIEKTFALVPEFALTASESRGIVNSYREPETMGVDRWCAIVAAAQQSRAGSADKLEPFCVVDAGSALTLDFVDANGNHCGGYITPGYSMQVHALLAGTQKVGASVHTSIESIEPANNTSDAVHAGILASMVAHIERSVALFSNAQSTSPHIFLTGGDATLLQSYSTLPMQIKPWLVIDGLKLLLP